MSGILLDADRPTPLNAHQFTPLADAHAKIEAWRVDYNQADRTARSGI
jgi:hypothetical protein